MSPGDAEADGGGACLRMPPPWRRRLVEWARLARPREACGLLLGPGRGEPAEGASPGGPAGCAEVCRALWSRNLAERADRYELDPAAHLLGERVARSAGLAVIGTWHSHPSGSSRPSATDLGGAHAGWWYVIVGGDLDRAGIGDGTGDGAGPELAAWWAPSGSTLEAGRLL